MNKKELIKTFRVHASNYDMKIFEVNRKYYHSIRVMNIALMIAKELDLNKDDIRIIMISGLLHDYARFNQWVNYNTFNDLLSFDHGNKAVEMLFNNKEIINYGLNEEYYPYVKAIIKNHNKYLVDESLDERTKKLCNIIRDADKIDIMNKLYCFISEDDKPISDKVKKDFYSNKLINNKDWKSINDHNITTFSLIFDINYDISLKYIKENKVIDSFYNFIKNKELFKEYYEYVLKYIDERMSEKC